MIDLDPDEELALVRDTARQFAGDHLAGRMRQAEAARAVDADVAAAYAEIGLSGLELPEAAGGAGLGALARVLVNEELAAADAGAALALDPLGPALYPLLELGAPLSIPASLAAHPQDRLLLATHLDGDLQLVGGGGGGTGPAARPVTAAIPWVPAERAHGVVLLGPEHAALVTEGFRIAPLRGAGLRAAGAGELEVRMARPAWLGRDGAGALRALARARLYFASLLLGVLRAACEFSCDYATQREAFGRPIAHHQALAFLITDMRIALDAARLLVHEAAWRVDNGLPAAAVAASAFAQCIEAAREIGPNGVQILGGHGFMADYPVEKHMRESRALGLVLGGFDAAIDEAGHALVESNAPLALGTPEAL